MLFRTQIIFCSSELRLHFRIAEVGYLLGLNRAWRAQVTQGCYTDTKRQWGKGGLREGGLMMGTSEEGTGRGMGGGREEASGGGIARGKDGAREQGNETSREVS